MKSTSGNGSGELLVSDEELERLCEFFYRKTGIRLDTSKRYFTDRRIAERMEATGSATFRQYFQLLHFDPSNAELQRLINVMTVNETYFFRENYQMDCLVASMLDEVVAHKRRPGDRLKIWSVPCATGEEPYSLAMSLLEKWPRVDNYDIEIHGSDIDSQVLAQAQSGIYDQRIVGKVPPEYLKKYFTALGGQRWRIRDELRGSVEFSLINIHDPAQTWRFREFDVIFCRNLLIYFDDASRRRAAEMFYESLAPGGFICLGHSESMSRMSSLFIPRKFPDAMVYQKPLKAA
jgi:chemotaxis protein methyltransferase CheR